MIPIFIILVSSLNDVLDFITAFFPGINEAVSIIFNVVIGGLVFLETLRKKIAGQGGIRNMVMKRIGLLAATAIMELPIIGLLPFQTVSAVVMYFMSKSEDDKHAADLARKKRQETIKRMNVEESRRWANESEDDAEPAYS